MTSFGGTPEHLRRIAWIAVGVALVTLVVVTSVNAWRREEAFASPAATVNQVYRDYSAPRSFCMQLQELDLQNDVGARLALDKLNQRILDGASPLMTVAQAQTLCNQHDELAGFVCPMPLTSEGLRSHMTFFDDATLRSNHLVHKSNTTHRTYTKQARDSSRCASSIYCPHVHTAINREHILETLPTQSEARRACDSNPSCVGVATLDGTGVAVLGTNAVDADNQDFDAQESAVVYLKSKEECLARPFGPPLKRQYSLYLENTAASRPMMPSHTSKSNLQQLKSRVQDRTCESTAAARNCFLSQEAMNRLELTYDRSAPEDQRERMYYVDENRHLLRLNRDRCCTVSRDSADRLKRVLPVKMPATSKCNPTRMTSSFFEDGCNEQCKSVVRRTPEDAATLTLTQLKDKLRELQSGDDGGASGSTAQLLQDAIKRLESGSVPDLSSLGVVKLKLLAQVFADDAAMFDVYRKDLAACVTTKDRCKKPTPEACALPSFRSACPAACTNLCNMAASHNSGCVTYDHLSPLYEYDNNFLALREDVDEDMRGIAIIGRGSTPQDAAQSRDNKPVPDFQYPGFYVQRAKRSDGDGTWLYTFRSNGTMEGGKKSGSNRFPNPWQGSLSFVHYDPVQQILRARDSGNYNVSMRIRSHRSLSS